MRPVLVAGPAGAGKSTVGVALAAGLRAVLLDLDTLTNPVLDAVLPHLGGRHWNDATLADDVRPGRYRALLDVAAAQVDLGHRVVMVAPFTAELAGGPAWDELVAGIGATPLVVWLEVPDAERARRLAERGEPRDVDQVAASTAAPTVPHLAVDGATSRQRVVAQVLAGIV